MRISIQVATAAIAAMLSAGLAAQAQQAPKSQPGTTPKSPNTSEPGTKATPGGPTVHIEGCVYPKRAIGAKTKVTVPEGSVEDYVLTDTKVIALAPGTEVPAGQPLKLGQVEPARLRTLTGKRAEVTARLENNPDMVQLNVVSIIETVGSCPPTPSAHS